MVLVIDDRFWGLLDTPFNQGQSAPLIGTKSKLCQNCDTGSFQALSVEKPFPQDPPVSEGSLEDPIGTVYKEPSPTVAREVTQESSDGGSNATKTADGGDAKTEMSDLTKVETVIAGLGIIVLMVVAITYGLKTILHK